MKNKILTLLLLGSFTSAYSLEIKIDENYQEDFTKNTINVTSVSEKLANKHLLKTNALTNKYDEMLNNFCSTEIKIFCSQESKADVKSCLLRNKDLIIDKCLRMLNLKVDDYDKNPNQIKIHDLKISKDTRFFTSKAKGNYVETLYKTKDVFDYRGLRFKRGYLHARTYAPKDYNNQYIIASGYPKSVFTDQSGYEYNPSLQKGPFFFDEKGSVTIGTLNKDVIYKDNIILKSGTIAAFDYNRNLVKGSVAKSVRVGSCGFLKNMIITEEKIKKCKN